MSNVLLVAVAALMVVNLLVLLWRSKAPASDGASMQTAMAQLERASERTERAMRDELGRSREESTSNARLARDELAHPIQQMRQTVDLRLAELQAASLKQLELMRSEARESGATTRQDLIELSTDMSRVQRERLGELQVQLAKLTDENAQALERMRLTVDEKLQGTLEKRIGESFKLVSERLEQVYLGLGEMKSLAAGVGDLKRMLSNVKSRGIWGEIQLRGMLEQVMSRGQFEENVSTKNNNERVEFVVKMPGRTGSDERVLLPIDAKFPLEDYRRLVDACETSDRDAETAARHQFELRLKGCAKDIHNKYINAPTTTDFAILYLPSESLFAEAVRNPSLCESLQQELRVVLAGPTTLYALLNSLQMGFRTLAIEQRSSEVWAILGAVKTEWSRYGEMLRKVQKKLAEATNVVSEAERRSQAVGRKLHHVEALPVAEAAPILMLETMASESIPAEV